MSPPYPVLHALLRDGVRWDAAASGLTCAPDGSLSLMRVPAPPASSPIRVDAPFDVEASGIAIGCDQRVYSTDTAGSRLVLTLVGCDWRYALPPSGGSNGAFKTPAGLSIAGDMLFVADSGNGRVLGFRLPGLELARLLDEGLSRPTSVAVDAAGRTYVVDQGATRIVRFTPDGSPDTGYDAAMAAHPEVTDPRTCVLGANDTLFVSDATTGTVLAFDADAHLLGTFTLPGGARPRALAAFHDRLFVADAHTGSILACDGATRRSLGMLPGFRGPVSAMAFDEAGNLFVKTGATEAWLRLDADAGCLARGTIDAGPLDAGVDNDWERIAVDADWPSGTRITLATHAAAAATPPPADDQWTMVPSTDALLARARGPANETAATQRYLWLRVTVDSDAGRGSPVIRQVHAETIGVSLLEQLPRMYRRDDQDTRFLERFLALGRGVLEDWDATLDQLYRRFDPQIAPVGALHGVAETLGFTEPLGLSADARRALLARVPDLYSRRGTVAGVRDMVEIASGMRPHIFEAYEARRVWQLDTSPLGFDTALAASAPDGMIVPGGTPTDPAYIGLRGDYYAGVNFDRHVTVRTDRTIEFDAGRTLNPVEANQPIDRFSVRWSGQIKPSYSETYTFYATPSDGVQLWVDGLPLVDSWTGHAEPGPARITLDATRWYPITFEIHYVGLSPTVTLEWTSRSQRREVIPAHALYSLIDERADLTPASGPLVNVGDAVVGATGPQPASDFGVPLFTDYAHLFTVVVAGAKCCEAGQRAAVRAALDAEKPAHTDYHLCFADARMRVGFQARLGIDAIVADGPPPMSLDGTTLGRDSYLAGESSATARVGTTARVGRDAVIS